MKVSVFCIVAAAVAVAVPSAIASAHVSSSATPRLHAFSDTTSVRVELTISASAKLNGTKVTGTITSAADSSVLWSGDVAGLSVSSAGIGRATGTISGLNPKRWSPQSPALYFLTVNAGSGADRVSERIRFGFRSMGMKEGRMLLNGRPLFLRGNAINPPERNIPDTLEENRRFVEPYIRYLQSMNVNIIRLTRHSQVWFDVADEVGMMLFQGNYGTPQAGKGTQAPTRPLSESVNWYRKDVIGPLVNHPSVVVYVLSNEQADAEIHYLKEGAEGINKFLTSMYDSLSAWDRTRLYIANAGYGFGRAGDICDLHRYWGWYYNSFLSFYTMRDPKICWRTNKRQPMTMTENVGNYTGVDGRFNLVPATKQPDSQLNWTGHAPQSEQSERALNYQAWMAKQAIEIYRRSREQNPNLAGLTPFTIVFHNWWGISGFQDMKPKPILKQYGVSYQPVLLSWEMWTPNAYAGSTIKPVVHVVNDADDGQRLSSLKLLYSVIGPNGQTVAQGETALADVPYYAASSKTVSITIPSGLSTGVYTLKGRLASGADTVSRNETTVFVAPKTFAGTTQTGRSVLLYDDAAGKTSRALQTVGLKARPVTSLASLSARDLLIVGGDAWDDVLSKGTTQLRSFVANGGRLVILHQDPAKFDGKWLPAPVRVQTGELDHPLVFPGGRPFRNGMSVNPERPLNPVFDGITRDRLFLWNDFTDWNESRPGFPQVYPVTRGFVVTDVKAMGNVAVLANYDHGLEGIALAEVFDGKGSVLMTGLDVVNRAGMDPVSDRLLVNMVRYMGSSMHENTPLFDSKITWGDYESERGLLTGIYSGLILNTVPVVPADLAKKYPVTIDDEGYSFAGGSGGWNTKPAIQYAPKGRRAFGPYTFTTGGSVELIDKKSTQGEGRIWLRVPASRTRMLTTISNPMTQALQMEISVNGASESFEIPGASTTTVESPVTGGDKPIALTFRGDRRLVLQETDFK